ncbi:MAG: hypothetical protein QXP13_06280 [Candidatus Methanomethylicia archaeon]
MAYATTYIYRGEYRDFIDYNITGDIRNCAMFNTKVINETKYFLICDGSGVYVIARINEFGILEEQVSIPRSYPFVFSPTTLQIGNIVYIPCIRNNMIGVCTFNVSRYIENVSDSLSYREIGFLRSGVGNDPIYARYISISPVISKNLYPSKYANMITIGDFTVAFVVNLTKIYFNFLDPFTNNFSTSDIRVIDFSGGLTDVKRAYVIPSNNFCMFSNDCFLHVVFEGRSAQNSNRYGIYVREIRYGTFGWEFIDKGIIGFDTSIGFDVQIPGVYDWFMNPTSPATFNKIYLRVIQDDKIIYAYYTLKNYILDQAVGLNYGLTNNTVFLKSKVINFTRYTQDSDVWYEYTGTIDASASPYLYFYYRLSMLVIGAPRSVVIDGIFNFTKDNISVVKTARLFYQSFYSSGGYSYDGELKLDSPFDGEFNVTIKVYQVTAPIEFGVNMYYDVVNMYNDRYTWYAIENNRYETEDYVIYPYAAGRVSNLRLRLFSSGCVCTEWSDWYRYNSTHMYRYRYCYPAECSDLSYQFMLNETAPTQPPTQPPTYPTLPPVNYTFNYTEIAERYNITGVPLIGLYVLSGLVSPIGIAFIIITVISVLASRYGGIPLGILTAMMLLILFSVIGLIPFWIFLILIMISALIFAYFVGAVFK